MGKWSKKFMGRTSSIGYGNVGYGNAAAAPWGGSGPRSAVMGQGRGASAGYGSSQGYGYGGNDVSYGAPSGYGAVGGRPGSMPNSHGGGYVDASDGGIKTAAMVVFFLNQFIYNGF